MLAATTGKDGTIYAIGGYLGNYTSSSEVDAYNPSTNQWTIITSLPTARQGPVATTGSDGIIYYIGGDIELGGPVSVSSEVYAYIPLPIAPLNQTISVEQLANQIYGVAPVTLTAAATSGLPVSFTVVSGPATLSGNVLTITGAGNVVVEADQPGNATYAAATPVDE